MGWAGDRSECNGERGGSFRETVRQQDARGMMTPEVIAFSTPFAKLAVCMSAAGAPARSHR